MNEIQIFNNEEFEEVRTVEENGKIYFCGTDIAKNLGYDQPHKAVSRHCKKDGGTFRTVIDSLGRKQSARFISEGNVYRLIIGSKLPSSQKFESWIFDIVIPTIRKTGRYGTERTINNADTSNLGVEEITKIISTTIINILPTLVNEVKGNENIVNESVEESIKKRRRRGNGVSKIEKLPLGIYNEVIEVLECDEFTFKNIVDFCTMNGYPISSSSVYRFNTRYINNEI